MQEHVILASKRLTLAMFLFHPYIHACMVHSVPNRFKRVSRRMSAGQQGSQAPVKAADGEKVKSGPSRIRTFFILIVLLAAILAGGYFLFFKKPETSKTEIEVSGRIEGYETNIGAKIGGRVDSVLQREGEEVKVNELVAQMSDEDIQAQLRGAEARIEKAREQVESAEDKLEVLKSQINESSLRVSQSHEDSAGRIKQWEANVAMGKSKLSQARAELIQSEADLNLAKVRKQRYEFLVSKEAVTRDEYDQVVNTFETGKALVESRKASVSAAEDELKAAVGQLAIARSSRISPHIEAAGKTSREREHMQAEHELKQAQHDVKSAIADRDQTKANIAYLKILSPIDGIVTARAVEPGAVLVPGQTILSVINLDTVYLRAYVPEGEIGKVRVGQSAEVFLDANPNKALEGKVVQVDPVGSFTPENIYFKNDRVKQVFGIKIGINQPEGFAKPGMPADAKIKLE